MDKNYNVDNILDEIKRRKAKQKGELRPSAPQERGSTAFSPVQQDGDLGQQDRERQVPEPEPLREPEGEKARLPRQKPAFIPRDASVREEGDGFTVVMPPVERTRQNPMNFKGHVQPITDRARMRPNRFAPGRPQPSAPEPSQPAPKVAPPVVEQEFTFVAPEPAVSGDFVFAPPQEEKIIDFSLYRPPVEEDADYQSPPVSDAADEHTRILPKFTFGQGIQEPDQAFQEEDYEGYYDEEGPEPYDMPGPPPADLGEYNRVEDRDAVGRDIAKVKLWLWLRTLFTFVLTVSLAYLTFSGKYPLPLPALIFPETNIHLFLLSFVALSVLAALICSSTVGNGIISLFKLRANSDSMAALALLASIGQSVAAAVDPTTVDIAAMNLYPAIAVLALLFNCLGKLTMVDRIQTNFRIIAGTASKRAVVPVESDSFRSTFLPPDGRRRPTVAHNVKADYFTDFLALSYSDRYDVGINRGVAPVCLVGAVLVAVLTYILTRNMATAFSTLTAILCVAATLSSTFIENIPLGKLTRKIAPEGGMVSGNKAVEDFCDTKAVVLGEKDLFPAGHLQLHGIKAYSQGRIDEAILDAASVICATDSALGPVFLEMIGGNLNMLKKVDNIVCEDEKGISAWVDSRRILIGNRELMQSHGVVLPDEAYRQEVDQQEGEVLYLSNSGEVSAQFVVSYRIDDELALELDYMAAKGIMLIVYAVDPNLTAAKLWSMYGYPHEMIRVMPASMHGLYGQMSAPREKAMAGIVYTGKAWVMLRAIRACMGARTSILTATIVQLVQVVLGYGMIAFIAFMGAMSALSFVQIGVYQLFWFFGILLVQQLRPE